MSFSTLCVSIFQLNEIILIYLFIFLHSMNNDYKIFYIIIKMHLIYYYHIILGILNVIFYKNQFYFKIT
jgi:hypothetical protein